MKQKNNDLNTEVEKLKLILELKGGVEKVTATNPCCDSLNTTIRALLTEQNGKL